MYAFRKQCGDEAKVYISAFGYVWEKLYVNTNGVVLRRKSGIIDSKENLQERGYELVAGAL